MRLKLKFANDTILKWVVIFLFFGPITFQAQMEEKFIGQVRSMNVVEAECTLNDGRYKIRFRDARKKRFPKYKSFHFPDEDNNFDKLKNLVFKGFESVPDDTRILEFAEEKVEIQFTKSAGLVSFRFAILEGNNNKRSFSSWFVKGKAEKIFGL